MRLPGTLIPLALATFVFNTVAVDAQRSLIGPDAAVGTEQERLASSIEFDSQGRFSIGEGFTATVRMSWGGSAAFMARTNYGKAASDKLGPMARQDAARSAFYNFSITSARVVPNGNGTLPAALEYELREAIALGNGGRPTPFYVPMLRVFRRIPPTTRTPVLSQREALPEDLKRLFEAVPPPGVLPVAEVGRVTARASYVLPDGMWASAPDGRTIETDFATYTSKYVAEPNRITVERTVVAKMLSVPLAREADLGAFYEAVEADRQQRFRLTFVRPGAESEADRLNAQGTQVMDRGDLPGAVALFQKVVALDRDHRWGWYNLGSAHLGRGDGPAAVEAFEKALAVAPGDAYVRTNLGQAYALVKRLDDAERTLKEQVERFPHSAWALQTIAGFYARQSRFADSITYGERAITAAPDMDGTYLSLGHTYLAINRVDEAANAFVRGIDASRNGLTLNEAAYALAERGAALDAALELIEAGLDRYAEVSGDPSTPYLRLSPHERAQTMAAMWDTAGWIRHRRGDSSDAVSWLEAAWWLSRRPDVASHLAVVLDALGRYEAAAKARLWESGGQAEAAEAAAALEKVPSERRLQVQDEARAELAARRSLQFASTVPGFEGDVLLTCDRRGRVLDARPASGPLAPPVLESLRAATVPVVVPPGEREWRLWLRSRITCASGNCTLTLLN